jgi:O-antigen ligase
LAGGSRFLTLAPYAIACLLAVVAWGLGGYEPWAGLALEISALALAGWLFASILLTTSREERLLHLRFRRSQKRGSAEVEILTPSAPGGVPAPVGRPDASYWFGYPFRKNGAGGLILLATAWMGLSLVPLPMAALSVLSPKAFAIRHEVGALLGRDPSYSPWSLTPFLTLEDLLLWLAYVMLFLVTHHLASFSKASRRLTACLLVLGIASGLYGLVQWVSALGGTSGGGANLDALRATGSFGNRNHYAFFQEMLLLVGLGWVYARWREAARKTPDRVTGQEAKARASLVALGIAAIGLSLVFSLSRSGITFGLVGCGLFLYLTRRGRRPLLALGAIFAAVALWIGVEPVISRFQLIPEELSAESGRTTVWRDSLGAVEDFWLTGSGLRSFQYVYPIYRSFGGRRFYSWAHNDYLQLGIELGLPGLLLALAFAAWAFRRAREVRRTLVESGSSLRALHAGYCSAIVAVALHSFTDFGLHLPANAALLTVVLGVATGMTPSRPSKGPPSERRKKLRRSPPAA